MMKNVVKHFSFLLIALAFVAPQASAYTRHSYAVDEVQRRLDNAVQDFEAKKTIRDEAREAWKAAKRSGDEVTVQKAYEKFMQSQDDVKEAKDDYEKARKLKYRLKFAG